MTGPLLLTRPGLGAAIDNALIIASPLLRVKGCAEEIRDFSGGSSNPVGLYGCYGNRSLRTQASQSRWKASISSRPRVFCRVR